MHFFSLDLHPDGEAETCYVKNAGYNQGDAERCPACGEPTGMLTWLPPFQVLLELDGREFGDFAFMPGSDNFLVSQKFRDVYYQHGLTGLSGFDPVEVMRVKFKKRPKAVSRPPFYFRVAAHYGRAALDMAASGVEWVEPPTCPQCRIGTIKRWRRLILQPGTWTGEDAFRPRGIAGVMISQRFKSACELHSIKNAAFTPAEQSDHDFYPWEATDQSNPHA